MRYYIVFLALCTMCSFVQAMELADKKHREKISEKKVASLKELGVETIIKMIKNGRMTDEKVINSDVLSSDVKELLAEHDASLALEFAQKYPIDKKIADIIAQYLLENNNLDISVLDLDGFRKTDPFGEINRNLLTEVFVDEFVRKFDDLYNNPYGYLRINTKKGKKEDGKFIPEFIIIVPLIPEKEQIQKINSLEEIVVLWLIRRLEKEVIFGETFFKKPAEIELLLQKIDVLHAALPADAQSGPVAMIIENLKKFLNLVKGDRKGLQFGSFP